MQRTFIVCAALLLSACLATLDSAFKVHGVIEGGGNCLLTATNLDSGRREEWEVAGEFEEMVVTNGSMPAPYDVAVSCKGKARKTLNGVRPSYEHWKHPLELGSIAP